MKKFISILSCFCAGAVLFVILVACSKDGSDYVASDSTNGKGGSMARFAIAGDHLYAVDYQTLKPVRLTDPQHPYPLDLRYQKLGFDIETIFPYDGKLFIGSQSGMYIYDITDPEFPESLSFTPHFTSCDPVVPAGDYAYVTLNSGNASCGRGQNQLLVYDITDLKEPQLVGTPKSMISPKGLGVDEEAAILFVCDRGLKAFDLSDPANPKQFWDLTDVSGAYGIETYDCIPMDGILLVTGPDGLYQFDYSDRDNIHLISKIDLRK